MNQSEKIDNYLYVRKINIKYGFEHANQQYELTQLWTGLHTQLNASFKISYQTQKKQKEIKKMIDTLHKKKRWIGTSIWINWIVSTEFQQLLYENYKNLKDIFSFHPHINQLIDVYSQYHLYLNKLM